MFVAQFLSPSVEDLQWLRKQAASAVAPKRLAERCQIVLLAGEGRNFVRIAAALSMSRQKASRWFARFVEPGRTGLENDAPGRGRKAVHGAQMQALIVQKTLRSRPPQATQWSRRSLAKALKGRDKMCRPFSFDSSVCAAPGRCPGLACFAPLARLQNEGSCRL
ncbi:MAG: helix-turn-helix domain-containing protein [Chthoniobacteraceae bacterium]